MKRSKGRQVVKMAGPIKLPVLLGERTVAHFRLYFFRLPDGDYYVLEKGNVRGKQWPLVRIHSACNIAHIFHSQRCDCQPQLELAMQRIHQARQGLIIYAMRQEGRGVGPLDHMRVYQKQDEGFDTVDSYLQLGLPVDARNYQEIKYILKWFHLKKILLMTNNPLKIKAVEQMGIAVKRKSLIAKLHKFNQSQIQAKIKKLGHLIPQSH